MMRRVAVVITGYLVFTLSAALLFAMSGQDPHLVPSLGFAIVSILYGMAFAFIGGWLAALLGRKDELTHAVFVAALIFLIALISLLLQVGHGSMWSQLAAIFLMSPSAIFGGWARRHSKK